MKRQLDDALLATVAAFLAEEREEERALRALDDEDFGLVVEDLAGDALRKLNGFDADGYDYVRKAYKVEPLIGQRVRLKDGNDLATIVPVASGTDHYVHFVIDGHRYVSVEHPRALDYLAERVDAAADDRLVCALAERMVPEREFVQTMVDGIRLKKGLDLKDDDCSVAFDPV